MPTSADGGKGFSADGEIIIKGGNITLSASGNGGNYINVAGLADSYSVSGFSSDTTISISGGVFNLNIAGTSGKGISSDKNVNISGTTQLNITNSGLAGKGIKADGNVIFSLSLAMEPQYFDKLYKKPTSTWRSP